MRRRFTWLHRLIGSIYVGAALLLAPLGIYIQYLDEAQGGSRSFTIATVLDAALLMTTTGIGLIFALKRMFPQHRQWMACSVAVALVFLEVRFVLGLTGLDQPFSWPIAEAAVWSCLVLAIPLADLANQWHELATARPRPLGADAKASVIARPAE